MKTRRHGILGIAAVAAVGLLTAVSVAPTAGVAQSERTENSSVSRSLAVQLRELQRKVAKLEAALKKKQPGMMAKGMGMKKGGMGMGAMSGMGTKNGNGMASAKGMGGKKMGGKGVSGMAMMGRMKGMGKMKMPSALPGFAGASHIYHIGATSFFLDHPQHITLSQEQQIKLNQIKEKALLGQATFDRWVSQGEQELWVLTSSDTPSGAKVERKIREIEKLGGDKRIAYIQAVGEAARVLTNEQRQTLVGNLPPGHSAANATN